MDWPSAMDGHAAIIAAALAVDPKTSRRDNTELMLSDFSIRPLQSFSLF